MRHMLKALIEARRDRARALSFRWSGPLTAGRLALLALIVPPCLWAPTPAAAEDASGLALVGADSLQGRSAYQVVPHEQNGRRLLYVGHHPGKALNALNGRVEQNGMSVLDVTDPKRPRYLHHQPPAAAPWAADPASTSGSYHFSVCDGSALPHGKPGRTYVLRTIGDVGHEVVDVTNPMRWRPASLVVKAEPSDVDKGLHTHNSAWDCRSGLAIVVASKSGWRATQIFQAFDLSDPEKPRHIRDFDLVGSEPGNPQPGGRVLPGAGFVNAAHAARIEAGRIYLAYNPFWAGTVQILDFDKFVKGDPSAKDPLAPTADSLRYPQIGRLDLPGHWGAHSAEPLLGQTIGQYRRDKAGYKRDLLVTLSEGTAVQCSGVRHVALILDISDPAFPTPISTYQADAATGDYCARFTYFGPHNVPKGVASVFGGRLLFVTYFAAGLRVVDIRNPFAPEEVGHYVPDANGNTHYVEAKGPLSGRELERTVLTNDVAVDDRGLIYITDRASTGLHILKLTGRPAAIAAEP